MPFHPLARLSLGLRPKEMTPEVERLKQTQGLCSISSNSKDRELTHHLRGCADGFPARRCFIGLGGRRLCGHGERL